jgi:flagellar motor switch protein FliG
MYELNLTAQVLEGLSDEEKNKTITTADLLNRVKKWQLK